MSKIKLGCIYKMKGEPKAKYFMDKLIKVIDTDLLYSVVYALDDDRRDVFKITNEDFLYDYELVA